MLLYVSPLPSLPLSMMREGVSIVIPAWNEEKRLPQTLARLLPVLEQSGQPYEVIVVADGVHDRTVEAAMRYSSRGVSTLDFSERLGKGGAVFQGFGRCRYDRIGYLDSDGPVSDQDVLQLIAALDDADCAVGSRYSPGSLAVKDQPLRRRMLRRGFHGLTRLVLGLPLYDTQCGAKFFRAASFWEIAPNIKFRGWAFDAALLFEMKRQGKVTREIPVNWSHDEGSKLYLPKQVPVMLASIFFIRLFEVQSPQDAPARWLWRLACLISRRPARFALPYTQVPTRSPLAKEDPEVDVARPS